MLASSRRSWRGDASRQVGRAASLRLETEHENTEESTGNSGQNRSFAFSSQAFQVFLTLQVECFILRRDDILFQLNSGCNSKLCCTTILVVTAHTLCRLCPGIVQCLPTVKMKNSQSLNVTGGIQLLFFVVCYIFVSTEINDFDVFPLFSLRFESHMHFVAHTARPAVSAQQR